MAAGYFLLLAQKKVTKEKGTLAVAVCRASMPGKLRKDSEGFAGSTSVCSRRSGRHPAGHRFAAFPPSPCRGREGTREEQSAAVPAAEAPDICDTSVSFLSFALLFGFPLSSGGGRTDQPRAPHAGGARDRADSDNRPWMACGPNPSARSEPLAPRAARIRGCRFLWLLSFGQAKESNWRPWMADEPHTDVSRSSRSVGDGKHRTNTIPKPTLRLEGEG